MILKRDILTRNTRRSVQQMLNYVTSCKRLTEDEEFQLGREYQTADENRRREIEKLLLESNMRFLVTVAKQYQLDRDDLDDLVQCAVVGLLDAIRRWDPTRGVKLICYAVHRIRREIYAYVQKEYTKYTSFRHFRYIREISKHYNDIVYTYGDLSVTSLMKHLGYTKDEAQQALLAYEGRHADSLDNIREVACEEFRPDTMIQTEQQYAMLHEALNKLDPEEREVLCRHYGIGYDARPMMHVAADMGMTRYKADILYNKAMRKLKMILKDLAGNE